MRNAECVSDDEFRLFISKWVSMVGSEAICSFLVPTLLVYLVTTKTTSAVFHHFLWWSCRDIIDSYTVVPPPPARRPSDCVVANRAQPAQVSQLYQQSREWVVARLYQSVSPPTDRITSQWFLALSQHLALPQWKLSSRLAVHQCYRGAKLTRKKDKF